MLPGQGPSLRQARRHWERERGLETKMRWHRGALRRVYSLLSPQELYVAAKRLWAGPLFLREKAALLLPGLCDWPHGRMEVQVCL